MTNSTDQYWKIDNDSERRTFATDTALFKFLRRWSLTPTQHLSGCLLLMRHCSSSWGVDPRHRHSTSLGVCYWCGTVQVPEALILDTDTAPLWVFTTDAALFKFLRRWTLTQTPHLSGCSQTARWGRLFSHYKHFHLWSRYISTTFISK